MDTPSTMTPPYYVLFFNNTKGHTPLLMFPDVIKHLFKMESSSGLMFPF